jgi:DNA repair protein RecN (Recombination protein N)
VGPVLVELRVRNLGVIDDVTVHLGPGTTALTGETGAGKTLLVGALGLLLGGRADPSVVRAGTDEALVEGRFDLQSGGEVAEVVLARSVARAGRSRAWIDGRMASIRMLSETAAGLIELHGQHQHRILVHADAQRQALDQFGRIDLSDLEAARSRFRTLSDESRSLGGDARERAREVDLLTFQVAEIDRASIDGADEDARLEVEEDRLAAASSHREAAAAALSALSGSEETGALDRMAEASGALAGRPPLSVLDDRVRAAMAELSDVVTDLRSVVEDWDDDPERLAAIRSRRQLFRELERKYGDDLAEVVAFAARARQRLATIDDDQRRAAALDEEIRAARLRVEEAEARVAAARQAAAPRLAAEIEATLRTLAMPSVTFSITVAGSGAGDQVTFLLGANPGELPQPLAKVASGGEMARTMLAIRLAITDAPGVMVFDEVDAGVGGAAATAVGAALAGLGRHGQVLVVTHLAQVAAQADRQLAVRKSERSGRTLAEVAALDADERVVELSRMLSGHPDSESARRHATELLHLTPAPTSPR